MRPLTIGQSIRVADPDNWYFGKIGRIDSFGPRDVITVSVETGAGGRASFATRFCHLQVFWTETGAPHFAGEAGL